MEVTSMANNTLLDLLKQDFPDLVFKTGKKFSFSPPKTVVLGPPEPFYDLLTLHEVGHALSDLFDYETHVERLKIETAAWEEAAKLYATYKEKSPKSLTTPEWDQNFVETNLDTYRNWLHTKSLCKKCGLTRYQSKDGAYHCPHCDLFT